jgi:hypothetical protein
MKEEALSAIKCVPKQEKLGHKQEKLGHKQEKLGHKHKKLGHHSLQMIQLNCSVTKSLDKNSPLTKVRPRKVRTRDATPFSYTIQRLISLIITTRSKNSD